MAGIYSSSEKYKPLCPSQILIGEKLAAEVMRVLEEEYINPFSILVAEDCLFNLSSGISTNDQLADEILNTSKLGKEMAMKFAAERLMMNGKKKFYDVLPKTRFAAFKMTAKSTKVKKNKKQRTIEVNRDILSWLVNLSVRSGMVINYEKAMEYPLSPVPLSIATAEGGRCTTSMSKLLDIMNPTLTVSPNSPKLIISIYAAKLSALIVDLIAAIRAVTKIQETYKQLAWTFLAALPKGYYQMDLVAGTYRDI